MIIEQTIKVIWFNINLMITNRHVDRLHRHSCPHYWVVVDQPLQQVSPVLHLSLPLQLHTGVGAGSHLGLTPNPVELPVLTETVLGTVASSATAGTLVSVQRVLGATETYPAVRHRSQQDLPLLNEQLKVEPLGLVVAALSLSGPVPLRDGRSRRLSGV